MVVSLSAVVPILRHDRPPCMPEGRLHPDDERQSRKRTRPTRKSRVRDHCGTDAPHPGPLLAVRPGDRLPHVGPTHRKRPHLDLPIAGLRPSAASLSATSRSAASMIQKPARYSFDSRKGPSVNSASSPRLSMTVAELGDPRPPANTQ